MPRKTILKFAIGTAILSIFFLIGAMARVGPGGSYLSDERSDPPSGRAEHTMVSVGDFEPAYLELHRSGELARRADRLWRIMESCRLCPRQCGVNRLDGERGFCRAPGSGLIISSAFPHFGEERPLVGRGGSGTIFFTHCNLRCLFCQNYEISFLGRGQEVSIEQLANVMLRLQKTGCHNINVVTPTHYSPHIVKALDIAAGQGLRIPVVWNTSGWERLEILRMLDGIVDIYLPDMKYADSEEAARFSSGADDYAERNRQAVLEMYRQVGTAHPAEDEIMYRGLMIRHLVMPDDVSGSVEMMEWIAAELPNDTFVNIMAQYTPHYKAFEHPRIARRVTVEEYTQVVDKARKLGLTNLDVAAVVWLHGD